MVPGRVATDDEQMFCAQAGQFCLQFRMHGLTVGQKDRGIHGSGQYRGRERVGVVIGACQDDGVRFGKGIFGQSDRRLNPVVAENAFGGDACGRCGRRGRCGRFLLPILFL